MLFKLEEFETPAFHDRLDEKHFGNGAFRKWRHARHVISLTEFSSNTNSKWSMIVALLDFSGLVWMENIWYVFREKPNPLAWCGLGPRKRIFYLDFLLNIANVLNFVLCRNFRFCWILQCLSWISTPLNLIIQKLEDFFPAHIWHQLTRIWLDRSRAFMSALWLAVFNSIFGSKLHVTSVVLFVWAPFAC